MSDSYTSGQADHIFGRACGQATTDEPDRPGRPRRGPVILAAAAFCVLAAPQAASAATAVGAAPPLADFRLPHVWEVVIVSAVCLVAIILWLLTRRLPIVGSLLSILLLMPIIEEYFFRYVGLHLVAIGLFHVPPEKALVYVGVIFALLHVPLVLLGGRPPFTARPVLLQVCDGLFIGCFNGLMLLNLMEVHRTGLLVTMIYCWLAHILINVAIVIYNVLVNTVLGGNVFAHLLPRIVLVAVSVYWFWWCWTNGTVITGTFARLGECEMPRHTGGTNLASIFDLRRKSMSNRATASRALGPSSIS